MSLGVFRQGNGLGGQCLVSFTKLSRAGGLYLQSCLSLRLWMPQQVTRLPPVRDHLFPVADTRYNG